MPTRKDFSTLRRSKSKRSTNYSQAPAIWSSAEVGTCSGRNAQHQTCVGRALEQTEPVLPRLAFHNGTNAKQTVIQLRVCSVCFQCMLRGLALASTVRTWGTALLIELPMKLDLMSSPPSFTELAA